MTHLISNTAFGDYLNTKNIPDYEYRYLRNRFDEFLKQPLSLWQFVPCKLVDGVWVVLETPEDKKWWLRTHREGGWWNEFVEYKKQYEEAKERVLFEGFEVIISENPEVYGILLYGDDTIYPDDFETIEDLIKYKPKLTPAALKQIGL